MRLHLMKLYSYVERQNEKLRSEYQHGLENLAKAYEYLEKTQRENLNDILAKLADDKQKQKFIQVRNDPSYSQQHSSPLKWLKLDTNILVAVLIIMATLLILLAMITIILLWFNRNASSSQFLSLPIKTILEQEKQSINCGNTC